MAELTTLLAFSGATILLVLLPGPNLLFILGAGISGGRTSALAAADGVELGTLVHVIAAAAGLSAVLQTSATAFSTVKYLGVAYLVYLGVRALRTTNPDEPEQPTKHQSTLTAAIAPCSGIDVVRRRILPLVTEAKVTSILSVNRTLVRCRRGAFNPEYTRPLERGAGRRIGVRPGHGLADSV